MYHYIRDLPNSRFPNIKGLDLLYFRKQIEYFENNFRIITVEDVLNNISSNSNRDCVLLTFDDGYIDHYTNVFPLMVEKNISGVFSMPGRILKEGKVLDVNKIHFLLASTTTERLKEKIFSLLDFYRGEEFDIPKNDVLYSELTTVPNRFDDKDIAFIKKLLQHKLDERLRNIITDKLFQEFITISEKAFVNELYMNLDQIKMMKRYGMSFGIHGYDHYWLGLMDKQKMQRDIMEALDVFNEVIDRNNWIMCYPYGSYNSETIDFLKKSACSMGFTTEVAVAKFPADKYFELPRLDTNDFPPKSENYLNVKQSG
jgi:peptidoglycan/xylan/chitin deacetylase (PgdA/CDA1 family)